MTLAATKKTRALGWGLLAAGVAMAVAGHLTQPNLFETFVYYDEVLHSFTSLAVAFLLATYLYGTVLTGARRHPGVLVVVLALTTLGLGAVWEMGEWGYDQLRAGDVILDKTDTIVDLIVDLLGALVGATVAAVVLQAQEHREGAPAPAHRKARARAGARG